MEKAPVLISTCLLGAHCRYDGGHQLREEMLSLCQKEYGIPVCGEQLGGLTTPRPPAERVGNKVLTNEGKDVTEAFFRGAKDIVEMAKKLQIKKAYLKSNSPMCGCDIIYDGTFSGNKVKGDGVLTELLKKEGIEVISVE